MIFDVEGFASLNQLPIVGYTSVDNALFGLPIAYTSDGSNYFITTNNGTFYTTDGKTFTDTGSTGSPPNMTFGGDAVMYQLDSTTPRLHVSGSTTVNSYASATWTSRITGLSVSYPHPLCVVEHLNQIAVGDGNTIKTYDTSYSLQNTLTIPAQYIVTWIRWKQNVLYIGTRNITGSSAKMFVWNGTGSAAQAAYGVQGDWLYAGEEYKSSIATIASTGQLLIFNGGGFDELSHLPVYETQYSWTSSSSPASSIGRVCQRGMKAKGEQLYINLDGMIRRNGTDYPGNYITTQPSGLWKFDPQVGLYHASGYTYTKYITNTVSSVSSNTLQLSGGHQCETGDAVFMSVVSGLTGVTVNITYYAVKISETSLQLALSPEDALNGYVVTVAGSPSTDAVVTNSYSSVCGTYDVRPGAVGLYTNVAFYDFFGTGVMFGGGILNNANTNVYSTMSYGLGRNIGHVVTSPIYSQNITDVFQRLISRIKNIELGTDKLIVKYKFRDRLGSPTPARQFDGGLATWTSGSTFTVDTTLKDFRSAQVGDEVTFISGVAAGKTSKITAIDSSTSVYVITIEDVLPVTIGDTSEVIAENWTTLGTFTSSTDTILDDYALANISTPSQWVEFKVQLQGKGVGISLLKLITDSNKLLA